MIKKIILFSFIIVSFFYTTSNAHGNSWLAPHEKVIKCFSTLGYTIDPLKLPEYTLKHMFYYNAGILNQYVNSGSRNQDQTKYVYRLALASLRGLRFYKQSDYIFSLKSGLHNQERSLFCLCQLAMTQLFKDPFVPDKVKLKSLEFLISDPKSAHKHLIKRLNYNCRSGEIRSKMATLLLEQDT